MTDQSEVLQTLKEMQTATAAEIVELLPNIKPQTVYAALGKYAEIGGPIRATPITRGKRVVRQYTYIQHEVVMNGLLRVRKANIEPTTVLTQRIAELEKWKADALVRYPELAVDPLTLKARAIAISVLEKENSRDRSGTIAGIRAGERDHTSMLRAILMALEQVA